MTTVTLDEACDSGISTCAAETTSDSDTALTASAMAPRSCASRRASTVTGSPRKPSARRAPRSGPQSGVVAVNSPRAFVTTVAVDAVAEHEHARRRDGAAIRIDDASRHRACVDWDGDE